MDLYEEFLGLIGAFDSGQVDYTVVGALALAIHGAPRATTDIDLLVLEDQVGEALRVAATVGFDLPAAPMTFSSGISLRRVTKARGSETLTLDLLVASGPLEEAWHSRLRLATPERALWVVSREALIKMKALAGRLRDLADIERLQEPEDG